MSQKRVVIIDVVGLTPGHLKVKDRTPNLNALLSNGRLFPMRPVFPAVTLPAHASLTTGVFPETHGVVANGFYFPDTFEVSFWKQESSLVQAERIWDRLRKRAPALKSSILFFQNSLYADCDVVITPKPMHTEEGLVQWCYSKPVGLYEDISKQIGEFNLMHYWGPFASIEASQWIAKCAVEVMAGQESNLMFVYLPHLDYCSQKLGPEDIGINEELALVDQEVGKIVKGIRDLNLDGETVFIILSEYTFSSVKRDIPLNRILREKGLLKVRTIQGREYLDVELSLAFAVVDHQVAHIYVKTGHETSTRKVLEDIADIDYLFGESEKKANRIDHSRSGDYIAISARDKWFSYYWWEDRAKEPDFATHIDIHRKPGYDPLELFFDEGTFNVSQDTGLIKGSHGYPALSESDQTVFMVSGELSDKLKIKENPCITDVTDIIEDFLIVE